MLIFLLIFGSLPGFAQTDSTITDSVLPANGWCRIDRTKFIVNYPTLKYSYSDATQTHNFSGNWDFDGDFQADSLFFVGTGGAHLYYYLRIILSSDKKIKNYPFINIDNPSPGSFLELQHASFYPSPAFPQFVIHRFSTVADPYGYLEKIYIHLDKNTAKSKALKKRKVSSSYVLLEYQKGELVLHDFIE